MKPCVSVLNNGFRVMSLTMPNVETAAVGVHVAVGSRHETPSQNGLAHFFEHMVFKATQKYNAREIAEIIEDAGGMLNAYTGRDTTVFHARVLKEDIPLSVSLLCELTRNPLFREQDLGPERKVVLSELAESRDTPDDVIFDHLQEVAFGDQALGRPILGKEKTLDNVQCKDLHSWLSDNYHPGQMLLSAAGAVDHDMLVDLAQHAFGDLKRKDMSRMEPAHYTGGKIKDQRDAEQTHITLGHEGVSYCSDTYYAVLLYTMAVGGGMSSRLFQTLREERGLAYSIYANHYAYAETGLFNVYLATETQRMEEALALTRETLAQCAMDLGHAEFKRAQAQAKTSLLMTLESCSGWAEYMARQFFIHGEVVPPQEQIRKIESTCLEQVRAAGDMLLSSSESCALVGP